MHSMDYYNFYIDLVWSLSSFVCVMKTKMLNGPSLFPVFAQSSSSQVQLLVTVHLEASRRFIDDCHS